MNGEGVQKNPLRASELYSQACDLRNSNGCLEVGRIFANGTGVAVDDARAVAFWQRACEASLDDACIELGRAYAKGRGVPEDPARAVSLYEKSCTAGSVEACRRLGIMHFEGKGIPEDKVRGLALLQEACDANNASACFGFAVRADGHAGSTSGHILAAYVKACDLDDGDACVNLGGLYYDGKHVARDSSRAVSYWEKACRLRQQVGCDNIRAARVATQREAAVDASQIWSDYDVNQLAADTKYRGIQFYVRGVVASARKDLSGKILIELQTQNEFIPVHAYMRDSEFNKVIALRKGDSVLLFCTGGEYFLGPILNDCVVDENSPVGSRRPIAKDRLGRPAGQHELAQSIRPDEEGGDSEVEQVALDSLRAYRTRNLRALAELGPKAAREKVKHLVPGNPSYEQLLGEQTWRMRSLREWDGQTIVSISYESKDHAIAWYLKNEESSYGVELRTEEGRWCFFDLKQSVH